MALAIKGLSYSRLLQDLDDAGYRRLEERFATVMPLGTNRGAIDVIANSFSLVGAADRVVEAGSTDTTIVLTGHGAQFGDFIQIKAAANPITQRVLAVREIPDANTIILEGVLDADLQAGDTIDILRNNVPRVDDNGSTLVTLGDSPIGFTLDGAFQAVTEDTVTPANNAPLPVKLTSVTGDINITANDLNVQLSHTGATPDSTQIGDGTEVLLISAAGEALTQPNGNVAANDADSGNPIKVGGVHNTALPTLDDGDRGNLQLDANGRLLVADVSVAGSVGTFSEDSAHTSGETGYHMLAVRQDALASSVDTDGDYASLKLNNVGELYIADTTARASLASIDGKMAAFDLDVAAGTENVQGVGLRISASGGSIEAKGQQTMANSIPVVISSDQSNVPVAIASSALPTGAATEATLAALAAEDFATETTLSALNDKHLAFDLDTNVGTENVQGINLRISANGGSIEAKGQQSSINSIPVVLASDSSLPATGGRTPVAFVRNDYSVTSVTSGAFVELTAALAQECNQLEIFDSSGQTLEIAFGAAGAEVVQFRVFPGGNGLIPVNIAAATRVSIRAVSATADAGEININFYQ